MDQAARYPIFGRIKMVKAYFATKSVVQTQRQLRKDFSLSRQKRSNQTYNLSPPGQIQEDRECSG